MIPLHMGTAYTVTDYVPYAWQANYINMGLLLISMRCQYNRSQPMIEGCITDILRLADISTKCADLLASDMKRMTDQVHREPGGQLA